MKKKGFRCCQEGHDSQHAEQEISFGVQALQSCPFVHLLLWNGEKTCMIAKGGVQLCQIPISCSNSTHIFVVVFLEGPSSHSSRGGLAGEEIAMEMGEGRRKRSWPYPKKRNSQPSTLCGAGVNGCCSTLCGANGCCSSKQHHTY